MITTTALVLGGVGTFVLAARPSLPLRIAGAALLLIAAGTIGWQLWPSIAAGGTTLLTTVLGVVTVAAAIVVAVAPSTLVLRASAALVVGAGLLVAIATSPMVGLACAGVGLGLVFRTLRLGSGRTTGGNDDEVESGETALACLAGVLVAVVLGMVVEDRYDHARRESVAAATRPEPDRRSRTTVFGGVLILLLLGSMSIDDTGDTKPTPADPPGGDPA